MKILNQHKISRLGPNTEFIESLCVPKISDGPVNSDIIMVGHGAAFFEVGGWDVIISAPYSLLVRAFRKSGRLGVGGEPTYMTHLTQMGLTGALLLLPIQICNWLIFSEPADKGAERQKRQLSRFSGERLKNSIGHIYKSRFSMAAKRMSLLHQIFAIFCADKKL